jgi:hypothetical protein
VHLAIKPDWHSRNKGGDGGSTDTNGICAVFVSNRKGGGTWINVSTRICVPSEDKALLL